MTNDEQSDAQERESSQLAFVFVQHLASELSRGAVELPSFPKAVMRIHRALADSQAPVDRVAQIVAGEPGLAARLLGMANSAAYNSGQPLTSIQAAVMRLGGNLVRSAAVAYAIAQLKNSSELRSIAAPLERLWIESTEVAALCFVLAKRTRVNPDESFLAGLLHATGQLYILARTARHPELFASEQSLDRIMRDWHSSIGKAVLQNWMLPEKMCEAIGDQDDLTRKHYGDADITDILACAKHLRQTGKDLESLAAIIRGAECFRHLHLQPTECAQLMDEARTRANLLSAWV
jgi:HD-like signal output (HDOD) protein